MQIYRDPLAILSMFAFVGEMSKIDYDTVGNSNGVVKIKNIVGY